MDKIMRPSEQIVVDTYNANADLWQKFWKEYCITRLAVVARSYIVSLQPLKIDSKFRLLDDPGKRIGFIDEASVADHIASTIANLKTFNILLKAAFDKSQTQLDPPKKHQIQTILTPFVKDSIRLQEANRIFTSITASDIYRGVSDLLACETYYIGKNNTRVSEAELLIRAILTYYFNRWQMPFRYLQTELKKLSDKKLGLSGSLVSIQNRFYESNNQDQFCMPSCAWPDGQFLHGTDSQSDLLRTINEESQAIPNNNGFFHKAYDLMFPVAPRLLSQNPHIRESSIRAARDCIYKQYEYSSLIFMGLVGIEYLLRSHCVTVQTGEADFIEILNKSEFIPADLKKYLTRVTGPDDWNIRNRCLHGSFLEIDSRRLELTLESGNAAYLGAPALDLKMDNSLLKNITALVLETLSSVTNEVTKKNCSLNTTWANHFILTKDELKFGNQVHCDLLQDLDTAKAWQAKIGKYLSTVTPCLSIPIQEGLRSWYVSSTMSTLPGFAFLMLLFEPLLRMTLFLAGRDILQKKMSNMGSREHYRVQYRMMDEKNLISPANVKWLTSHLSSNEIYVAKKTLMLAVKCRNAFAHGAVINYTKEIHDVYGHIVIKAIQLIVDCGTRHLGQTR